MEMQATIGSDSLIQAGPARSIASMTSCRAEVSSELLDEQGQVLDSLIGFVFDVWAHLI